MANFNKVIIAGNLTRDPELRYTPKGTAVAKIGMALNRTWRDESGATKEEVTFVDIEAFGRQAETIAQYVKKGRPLLVEGRLRLDSWEDKQTNQKRSRMVVVLESFSFLDSGNRGASEEGAPAPNRFQSAPAPSPAGPSPASTGGGAPAHDDLPPEEDDVPF